MEILRSYSSKLDVVTVIYQRMQNFQHVLLSVSTRIYNHAFVTQRITVFFLISSKFVLASMSNKSTSVSFHIRYIFQFSNNTNKQIMEVNIYKSVSVSHRVFPFLDLDNIMFSQSCNRNFETRLACTRILLFYLNYLAAHTDV